MHSQQLFQHALQLVEMQRIRAIALRLSRIVVDLEKHPIDSRCDRRSRQHRNKLRLSAAYTVTS